LFSAYSLLLVLAFVANVFVHAAHAHKHNSVFVCKCVYVCVCVHVLVCLYNFFYKICCIR